MQRDDYEGPTPYGTPRMRATIAQPDGSQDMERSLGVIPWKTRRDNIAYLLDWLLTDYVNTHHITTPAQLTFAVVMPDGMQLLGTIDVDPATRRAKNTVTHWFNAADLSGSRTVN